LAEKTDKAAPIGRLVASAQSPGASPVEPLPNKLYFRIGEVAKLAGVKPYVLRYWETEFPSIEPKKTGTNHRLYRRKDVETVLEIKRLLYDQRFTIEGARKHLSGRRRAEPKPVARPKQQVQMFDDKTISMNEIRDELQAILRTLS